MLSPTDSLKRLIEGNRRYATDFLDPQFDISHARRRELVGGQLPFAIILGCSDSRVPAEIVFDQGLGDLFVIRVAGNIVSPSQVGSVEFAAVKFQTQLVVVMGHTGCGAIEATLESMREDRNQPTRSLQFITEHIRPAIEPLFRAEPDADADTLAAHAVRANILASANHLRHGSALLEERIAQGQLLIVSAEYNLESGTVEFFDGVPASITSDRGG